MYTKQSLRNKNSYVGENGDVSWLLLHFVDVRYRCFEDHRTSVLTLSVFTNGKWKLCRVLACLPSSFDVALGKDNVC